MKNVNKVTWRVVSIESNSFGDQIVEFEECSFSPTVRYFKVQRPEEDWYDVKVNDFVKFNPE